MIFSQAWAPIAQKMHKLVPVVIEPEVVVPREYQVVFVIIMTLLLTFHHHDENFVMNAYSCREASDNAYTSAKTKLSDPNSYDMQVAVTLEQCHIVSL